MENIKIIAMDIDGTLYNSEKKITQKTKETLLKYQNEGYILMLASGRPTSGLVHIAHELEMDKHNGLLVCYNGSKVIDASNNEVLFNQALSVEEGKAVLEHMKKFDRVRPMIDKGEYMYVNNVYDNYINYKGKPFNVIEYESRGGHFKLCEVDDLAEFCDFELNKILTTSDPEYLQEHYKEMAEPFKDTLSCMFTGDFYFEFTANGIDKAKAIDTVLQKMGLSGENMIAFGDGQNDASMLKYSKIAIAMENAVQELKDIADDVTLSNDEDGIAVALEKWL
jgi:Cof subfamily protein (haloacid dehalogenase superfamily)